MVLTSESDIVVVDHRASLPLPWAYHPGSTPYENVRRQLQRPVQRPLPTSANIKIYWPEEITNKFLGATHPVIALVCGFEDREEVVDRITFSFGQKSFLAKL